MIVYRATTEEYSDIGNICSGEGAKLSGGRWNLPGVGAIYSSQDLETAIIEKSYYLITSTFFSLGKSKGFTKDDVSILQNIKFKMVKLELATQEINLVDFTNQSQLSSYLKLAGLPPKNVLETRSSSYSHLQDRWTQKLGTKVILNNQYEGFRVFSARNNARVNYIFNPNKVSPKTLKIMDSNEIILDAVSTRGTVWDGKGSIDPWKARYQIPSKNLKDIVNIEEFN